MVDCTHGVKSLLSSYGHRRYTDYGCYCGRGGSGDPIDNIDKLAKKIFINFHFI